MNLPSWMDVNFFSKALMNYYKEDYIKILGYTCKPAVSVGENYTTDVYRVNVSFNRNKSKNVSKESLALIVKCTREGLLQAFADEMNLFYKEIDMFVNILPMMSEIYGQKGIFAANCVYAILEPLATIIMEDLCPSGFSVPKRRCGLDLQHTLQVLKKMAIFHASSVAMFTKNPSILGEMYTTGLYSNKEMITNWLKLSFESLLDTTKNCKDFLTYYERLSKMSIEKIYKSCFSSWKTKDKDFIVLNHGDLWINNIMFSYDKDGKPNNCKLVDFQMSISSSPVLDLHYFFATSLADNIRNRIDFLLDFYYSHLLVALTELGYNLTNVPTRTDFLKDFNDRAFYGFIAAATVLPIVKAEERNDANFENLLKTDSQKGFRYHCYNNEIYKSALSYLLPYYNKLGIFDNNHDI